MRQDLHREHSGTCHMVAEVISFFCVQDLIVIEQKAMEFASDSKEHATFS